MASIAIFGGTFNPFHIGHYEMLKSLCNLEYIDKVLVIPDRIPPHKVCDFIVSDDDRISMCRIACNDFKKAELSLIEFEREGKSYTFDTLKMLKAQNPSDRFYIAVGGDMLESLDTWYNWKELISSASFIAFSRGNKTDFLIAAEKMRNLGADIKIIDDPVTDISSTLLRGGINKKYLPEKIYDYITERELYNGKNT